MDKLFDCGTCTLSLHTNGCSLLSFNKDLVRLLGYQEDFPLHLRKNFLSAISPMDRQRFLQSFSQAARPGAPVKLTVNGVRENGTAIILYIYGNHMPLPLDTQVYNCVFLDVTQIADVDQQLIQADQRLGMLVDTMQDGVIFYRYDHPLPPQFISPRMLELMDCSEQQLMTLFQKQLLGHIDQRDWEWLFPPTLPSPEQVELREFSIITCTGKNKWLTVVRQLIPTDEDGLLVCITARDITEKKQNLRELEIEQQRYRLLCKYTQDLLYDYDLKQDILVLYGNMERINGEKDYSWPLGDFLVKLPTSGMMPPEDAQKFRQVCLGESEAPMELQIRFPSDGEKYSWYSVRHGSIRKDSNGKAVRVLGVLSNIDQTKRESEHLRALSEQDTFTGLLNKNSTNDAISEYLKNHNKEEIHALLMMDLDHFKDINDTYGHQFGDSVLLEFSKVLRRLFRSTDIVGRVGGDEFLVFMKQLSSETVAEQKAALLCETFRNQALFPEHPDFRVECSVGLALAPKHGADYHSLYEKADKALYRAKKNGRCRYEIYSQQSLLCETGEEPRLNEKGLRGEGGGMLSQGVQLLRQSTNMKQGLQLVLEQAANYWNTDRIWMIQLSPLRLLTSWSSEGEGLSLEQLTETTCWNSLERFDSDGLFCCKDLTVEQRDSAAAFHRCCPQVSATLQYHFRINSLEFIIGLDQTKGPRRWTPREAAQLTDLAGLLGYYIVACGETEEQS